MIVATRTHAHEHLCRYPSASNISREALQWQYVG